MGQVLRADKIVSLQHSGNDIILGAGSYVTIGGQQYPISTAIQASPSLAASTFYYAYAVLSGLSVVLVADVSETAPTGYDSYRKIGAFYTDGSGNIFKTFKFGDTNQLFSAAFITNAGVVSQEDPFDVFDGNGVEDGSTPFNITLTFNSGIFSVTPMAFASAQDSSSNQTTVTIFSVNTTTLVIYRASNDAPNANFQAYVMVIKQGIDSTQPDWTL